MTTQGAFNALFEAAEDRFLADLYCKKCECAEEHIVFKINEYRHLTEVEWHFKDLLEQLGIDTPEFTLNIEPHIYIVFCQLCIAKTATFSGKGDMQEGHCGRAVTHTVYFTDWNALRGKLSKGDIPDIEFGGDS